MAPKSHVWRLRFQDMDHGVQQRFVVIPFNLPVAMTLEKPSTEGVPTSSKTLPYHPIALINAL
jgi:hypothetical protein